VNEYCALDAFRYGGSNENLAMLENLAKIENGSDADRIKRIKRVFSGENDETIKIEHMNYLRRAQIFYQAVSARFAKDTSSEQPTCVLTHVETPVLRLTRTVSIYGVFAVKVRSL
jgi:hypothetical protein